MKVTELCEIFTTEDANLTVKIWDIASFETVFYGNCEDVIHSRYGAYDLEDFYFDGDDVVIRICMEDF